MLRAILGVIAGYLVMMIVVFVTFTVAYLVMGTEKAFQPESFDASMLWIVTSIVLGAIAAVLGGLTCAAVARGGRAPLVLAGIVLGLGLAMAVPAFLAGDESPPPARSGELDNFEAMTQAKQPTWLMVVNPIIGCVGVLIGASMVGGRRKAQPAE
ncbi:MAG: hypothetical protein ACYTJ0_07195 [Planctomycetota bacterium]|jgi:hypothetical protein